MLKKIISFAVTAAMLITMVCAFSFASAEGLMKIKRPWQIKRKSTAAIRSQ